MGRKMIKGRNLALLILIFIFALVPVSCDNNSSNNSYPFSASNVSNLNQQFSANISETDLGEKPYQLDLVETILAIIVAIIVIVTTLAAFYFWIYPEEKDRAHELVSAFFNRFKPVPPHPSPKRYIRLPHPPNPKFTGRQEFLSALAQFAAQAVSRPKIFALVGNGGMGKTQIALQHAHNPKNDFKYIWWLRSEEPTTLLDEYISIAEYLNLPGWNLRDKDKIVTTVRLWLEAERKSSWLLIFDYAQKPEDLERFIPVAGNGQVIITSRQSVWDGIAETLKVGVFQRDKMEGESVDFLLKRTSKADRKGAAELAKELGDLPLALEQAGSYIEAFGISFSDYLARLKDDRKKKLSQGKPQNYPDSVATTWEISFQAVQEEIPAAGDLLNLFAFLAPDAIPRSLLEGAKHLPEPLSTWVKNRQQLDDCIALLNRYSLISAADNLISIHRLVQAVVQDRLSPEDQRIWTESALKIVNDAFSFSQLDEGTWEKCSKLSSHALSASEHSERLDVSQQETANLLNSLGNYLHNRMELASARTILERALAIDEKALGPEHIIVASIANNLGMVLKDQGELGGAKKCFQRALAIDENNLGKEHTSVASITNNLGLVLKDHGELDGAKKCFQRALAIDEKALGKDHTSVARDVNNLGSVRQDQGDLDGARKCFEKALAIDEKALGKEHTSVASIASNLGSVLQAQGDLEGAKKCYQRALAIDEKDLGKDHTSVARDVNNLGSVRQDQGDLDGARKCFEKALAIDEKALGKEHTSVARDVNNLGSVLRDQGDLEGAKKCFERALAIDEKALGPDHTSVAIDVNNLGSVLRDQGDLEGAKKCLQRALAIDEKAFGPDHTSVARDVNNLGSVLQAQGDLDGAKECQQMALAILEKRLGKDHSYFMLVRNNLRKLQK